MKNILFIALVCFVFLPFITHAQTLPSSSLNTIASLQAQVAVLLAQLNELKNQSNEKMGEEEWKFNYSKSNVKLGLGKEDAELDEETIKRFLVRNNRLYEDGKWTRNTDTDEYAMWNLFAEIAGDDFVDEYITRYATYRISDTGTLGFVKLLDDEEPSWGLAVNANASNFDSEKWMRDLVAVLIHEYTHVLTLNGDQVHHKQKKESVCRGNYLSNKGCTEKKSYLNNYVAQFWEEDDFSRKTPAKEKYFTEHPDEFVTEYGLKSPEEDIAESFTQFILYEKPEGTKKKDLKILFFYSYPELVEMRTRIREAVEEYYVN
jgi:hypothetical protein